MRRAWLLVLIACDGSAATVAPAPIRDAVAQVDGDAIAREEVERLARATATTPQQALHALVRERLLVAHARRTGYGDSEAVRRAEAQAMVRVLLEQELGMESEPVRIEAQRAKLASLLARLSSKARVQFHEDTIARAFASPH